MTKKRLMDYTPEQRLKLDRRIWNLHRRALLKDEEFLAGLGSWLQDTQNALDKAHAFNQAASEMGRDDLDKWCAENPLSPQAQIALIEIQRQKDAPAVAHGEVFKPKRKKGAISKKTKHIQTLVEQHPEKTAKELYALADKSILGEGKPMQLRTFDNHVSLARKPKK
jgi:hypothetical protein